MHFISLTTIVKFTLNLAQHDEKDSMEINLPDWQRWEGKGNVQFFINGINVKTEKKKEKKEK